MPLLCRNDPCLDGVIADGKNGFRYENFEEYEAHLDYVMSNPEWLKSAGAESEAISYRYDRTVFGGTVEALYKEAIGITEADEATV